MAQLIIDTGAAANDGTGDPLRTAFTDTNLNFTAIYTAGPVDSNIQITNNTILTINTNGNLVLSPNGIGKVVSNVDIVPNTANVRNLGSSTARWSSVYTQYLDVSGIATIASVTSAANFAVVTDSANTAQTWRFGADGALTLPYGSTLSDSELNTLTLGYGAGNVGNAQNGAIAIGWLTGNGGQGYDAVAIGSSAASDGFQGESAVAIGSSAGGNTQGVYAVAVGTTAGQWSQGGFSVAVGYQAGGNVQGSGSIAIGTGAGYAMQGNSAVAIGVQTGATSQGSYAVAIGSNAGNLNQADNSIILNATGSVLNQTTANTFTVKPVRNGGSGGLPAGFYQMAYNPTTGEIVYYT